MPVCSPYDTLEEVIGLRGTPGNGSLIEWGIKYRELALATDGQIDWEALATAVVPGGYRASSIHGWRARELLCLHVKSYCPNADTRPQTLCLCGAGKTKVCHIQRSCGYSMRPTL